MSTSKVIAVPDDFGDDETSLTRAEAALQMKLAGAPYDRIAETLDFVSPTEARKAVERCLARAADEFGDKDRLRSVLNKRMERLSQVCYLRSLDKSSPDQIAWMRTFLAYADRISKMNGLEATATTVVITPDYEEIVQWARHAYEQVSGEPIVIEAEIVEDEIEAEVERSDE